MAFEPDELVARLEGLLSERATAIRHQLGQVIVEVEPSQWTSVVRTLHDDVDLDLDYFGFLSAIDWVSDPSEAQKLAAVGGGATPGGSSEARQGADGYESPEGDVLQVVCRLASARRGHGVTIKTNLDPVAPQLPSITSIYGGADWHERECHEMFGVEFVGHPNPKKLYLPDDFEGNPLRKIFALGSRLVKPWPGHVDVEEMPESSQTPAAEAPAEEVQETTEAATSRAAAGVSEGPSEAAVEAATREGAGPEAAQDEAAASAAAAPVAPPEAPPETEPETAPEITPETLPETPATPPPPPPPKAPPTDESIEAESMRTGIPVAVLQRMREARERAGGMAAPQVTAGAEDTAEAAAQTETAPGPVERESAVAEPSGSADDEAALQAESDRTGIPVTILRRMYDARRKAGEKG